MKKIIFVSILLITSNLIFGQKQVSIDDINTSLGKEIKVCAKYYGIKETEKVTLLNVGSAWPNSPLTIVIYSDQKDVFKKMISQFKKENTTICVTGTVSEFKGKMQIVIENASQMEIVAE